MERRRHLRHLRFLVFDHTLDYTRIFRLFAQCYNLSLTIRLFWEVLPFCLENQSFHELHSLSKQSIVEIQIQDCPYGQFGSEISNSHSMRQVEDSIQSPCPPSCNCTFACTGTRSNLTVHIELFSCVRCLLKHSGPAIGGESSH